MSSNSVSAGFTNKWIATVAPQTSSYVAEAKIKEYRILLDSGPTELMNE